MYMGTYIHIYKHKYVWSPSCSLGESGQKLVSIVDVEGIGSEEVWGLARKVEEASLTVRESEVFRECPEESPSRDPEGPPWGGGVRSASSDSEEADDDRQSEEWLVLRLLLELIEASRRWRLPFDRFRECRLETQVSASDESEVERTCDGVGLPAGDKPTVGPRLEPLAWSQVVGWGLPPCQVTRV